MGPNNESLMAGNDQLWYHAPPITHPITQISSMPLHKGCSGLWLDQARWRLATETVG